MNSLDVLLLSMAVWVCLQSLRIVLQGALATAVLITGFIDSMLSGVSRVFRGLLVVGVLAAVGSTLWVWWLSGAGGGAGGGLAGWLGVGPTLAIRLAVNQWAPQLNAWLEDILERLRTMALWPSPLPNGNASGGAGGGSAPNEGLLPPMPAEQPWW